MVKQTTFPISPISLFQFPKWYYCWHSSCKDNWLPFCFSQSQAITNNMGNSAHVSKFLWRNYQHHLKKTGKMNVHWRGIEKASFFYFIQKSKVGIRLEENIRWININLVYKKGMKADRVVPWIKTPFSCEISYQKLRKVKVKLIGNDLNVDGVIILQSLHCVINIYFIIRSYSKRTCLMLV